MANFFFNKVIDSLVCYLLKANITVAVIEQFKKRFVRKIQVTYKSQGFVNLYQNWKIEQFKDVLEMFIQYGDVNTNRLFYCTIEAAIIACSNKSFDNFSKVFKKYL